MIEDKKCPKCGKMATWDRTLGCYSCDGCGCVPEGKVRLKEGWQWNEKE